ncbi:MAG TPA: LamG-like jellyroll fold domain-containing protein, partial [Verrucomicrobiae bacterium]
MKSNNSFLSGIAFAFAFTLTCPIIFSTAPGAHAADYALGFNAAQGESVLIPHLAAQDSYPFTVMCWFMEPTNSPGGGALVGNYVSSSYNGWQIAIGGQLYAWYWRDSGDNVGLTPAGAVNDGLWHHAAFVVNSAGGVLYLDGVPKQTNAWAGTAGPCSTTGNTFLGLYQGDSFLTADVAEVSIWNVALTQSQIQTYMHQPPQGTETGLVNCYRMNEGSGANIYDSTANADTGVFSPNPPAWILSGAQVQEAPQVATLPAVVSANSATLSGTINPQGENAGCWFRWGLTASYGNVTATNTFAAGYTNITNSKTLSGLFPGTYHFQIVGTNASGTSFGGDQTFTINEQFQLGTSNLLEGPLQPLTAGSDSVILAASAANASWTVTPNASWLHVPAPYPASGLGSTNILFTFDANTNATRVGTISIADQTLTVTQAGASYVAAPGPATALESTGLLAPFNAAVDSAGNVYISDLSLGILEWVRTNSTVKTLASGGYESYGIAVDKKGNVYFSSITENAIFEWVAASNQVVTLVNSGLNYPAGVAVDAAGNVYFADAENNAIKEWVATNNSVVTLVSSGLGFPEGVAVDIAGNIYIANTGQEKIEKLSAAGGLTTLAGFNAGNYTPVNLAVDGSGNVLFGTGTGVWEWSPVSNSVNPVETNGITSYGAAVDNAGNIYIADFENAAVKELLHAFLDPSAKGEPFIAGNDTLPVVLPTNALQYAPFVPTSNQSWLTVTGAANGVTHFSFTADTTGQPRVAQINLLGETIDVDQSAVILGTANLLEGPAAGVDSVMLAVPPPTASLAVSTSVGWLHPAGGYQPNASGTNVIFTFDANPGATRVGTIFIGYQTLTVIQAGVSYVAAPGPLTTLAPYGFAISSYPGASVAVDNAGNVYGVNAANHAVMEWWSVFDEVITLTSDLERPTGLAMDTIDNLLFIADAGDNTIYLCGLPDARLIPLVTSGLASPEGIGVDDLDNVYINDVGDNSIKRWNIGDGSISVLVTNLYYTQGMTVDNAGDVYVAGAIGISGTNAGVFEWVAGTSNLVVRIPAFSSSYYTGMAVDGSGNIYVGSGANVLQWN